MALMRAALAWERFVLKDVKHALSLAKVRKKKISRSADKHILGGAGPLCWCGWDVEGCGQPHQGCSHLQVGSGIAEHSTLFIDCSWTNFNKAYLFPGFHEGCGCEHCCCHRDRLLVLHWRVHRKGELGQCMMQISHIYTFLKLNLCQIFTIPSF